MSQITIVEIAGELVVDSRIIAEQLGIEHKNFLETLRKHKAKLEKGFKKKVAFQTEPSASGQKEVFALLNEGEATALMALSRNTDRVVELKIGLAVAFQEQKKQLENPVDRALFNQLADRIAKLESSASKALPPVVPEMTRAMQVKELVYSYVERMDSSYEKAYRLLYNKFGLLYNWKPDAKSKLSKIAQIEAAGLIESLYQLALKLFI
jgi:phage regulator Rha-like protein